MIENTTSGSSLLTEAEGTLEELAREKYSHPKVAVKMAEEALHDSTLRAPFDGVVTARLKNVGETVSMMPPTAVITLVDLDALEVDGTATVGLDHTREAVIRDAQPDPRSIGIDPDLHVSAGGGVLDGV